MICKKQEEKCQNIFEFDSWLCAQYLFSYFLKKSYTKQYWTSLPVLKFSVFRVWLVSKLPTAANSYKIIHDIVRPKYSLQWIEHVPWDKFIFHMLYLVNVKKNKEKDFNQISQFLNES